MKHSRTDRMADPFYAELLFKIEQRICLADDDANSKGVPLTDSQIRSAIIKTQKILQGGNPKTPETNERERVLAGLIQALCRVPDDPTLNTTTHDSPGGAPLTSRAWINALETVQDSIDTRRSSVPGSREYLTFVHGFIGGADQ